MVAKANGHCLQWLEVLGGVTVTDVAAILLALMLLCLFLWGAGWGLQWAFRRSKKRLRTLAEKAAREHEKAEADRARAARGQDVTAIVQAVPVNGNQATSNGRFYRQEEEQEEFYDGDEGPFTGSVQSDRAA